MMAAISGRGRRWLRGLLTPALLALGLYGLGALASVGLAQDEAAEESASESRSESFQAVEGAVEEDISGGPLMLTVYAITWVGIFLYVLRLVSLQQRTLKEVQHLNAQLSAAPQRAQE